MLRVQRAGIGARVAFAAMVLCSSGCTSLRDYVHNGFKVGPNYCPPQAPVAEHWIDAADARVRNESDDLSQWWTVFNDPVLDRLIATAYWQNLTLREACFRVLAARAQLGIAMGDLFPQTQNASGSYRRQEISLNPPGGSLTGARFSNQWAFGFNLGWELDFWGRLRRAVAAADDLLDASVYDYDDVLVTLLGDVATNYVQIRTDQQRITLLEANAKLQNRVLEVLKRQVAVGSQHFTTIDVGQGMSILKQTQAQIPQLEIDLRQANDRLSILLGTPPAELRKTLDVWAAEDLQKTETLRKTESLLDDLLKTLDLTKRESREKAKELWKTIGTVYIPTTPKEVAVGIPADLLRRRPDVRRAERQAAAQAELIGIAQAELYPIFSITGTLGYQAREFSSLFTSQALSGSVGPSFQWNILNYGRIINNVRFQDARFQELAITYQNTVLQANAEVEDGLVTFLRAQQRADLLGESVEAGVEAHLAARWLLETGGVPGFTFNFNQYAVIEQNLVQQADSWAQARGQIALGLIQVYRALGGGWQIRLQLEQSTPAMPSTAPPDASNVREELPAPPDPPAAPKGPATAPQPGPNQPWAEPGVPPVL